jgi:hypothetical protein
MAESPWKPKLGTAGAGCFRQHSVGGGWDIHVAKLKIKKDFLDFSLDTNFRRFHDESSLVEPAIGASVLTAIRYMHAAGTDKCNAGLASSGSASGTGVRELDSQDRGGAYMPQVRPVLS